MLDHEIGDEIDETRFACSRPKPDLATVAVWYHLITVLKLESWIVETSAS